MTVSVGQIADSRQPIAMSLFLSVFSVPLRGEYARE
jgi:hypothetical protein